MWKYFLSITAIYSMINVSLLLKNIRRWVKLRVFSPVWCFVDRHCQLKLQRARSRFHVTTRYASMSTHRHRDMGRFDNFWSIFDITIENICNWLSWHWIIDSDQVVLMKNNCNLITSIINLHCWFVNYWFTNRSNYPSMMCVFARSTLPI